MGWRFCLLTARQERQRHDGADVVCVDTSEHLFVGVGNLNSRELRSQALHRYRCCSFRAAKVARILRNRRTKRKCVFLGFRFCVRDT